MNKTKTNQDDSKDASQMDKRNRNDTQHNNKNGFIKTKCIKKKYIGKKKS